MMKENGKDKDGIKDEIDADQGIRNYEEFELRATAPDGDRADVERYEQEAGYHRAARGRFDRRRYRCRLETGASRRG